MENNRIEEIKKNKNGQSTILHFYPPRQEKQTDKEEERKDGLQYFQAPSGFRSKEECRDTPKQRG